MVEHDNIWLHRFAMLLAWATLILVTAGASVTSTGSGLAVPDWPLSFGTFFPPMVGGVLFEHGHRMIAGVVLVLTLVLMIWLLKREKRAWVRRLGVIGLVAVLVQAVLGGLTVLLRLPTITSVSHAALAMAFFCLTVGIALFTSPGWRAPPGPDTPRLSSLRKLALITTGAVYLQILIGAYMRHTGAGLVIPDFPLSYGRIVPPYWSVPIAIHFTHRLGALVVSALVVALIIRVFRHHRTDPGLTRPAIWLGAAVLFQIFLGALTIWTQRAPTPTTFHVGVGAAVLAISLVVTLRAFRLSPVSSTKPSLVQSDVRRDSPVAST